MCRGTMDAAMLLLLVLACHVTLADQTEDTAQAFMVTVNQQLLDMANLALQAEWDHIMDVDDAAKDENMRDLQEQFNTLHKSLIEDASDYAWQDFQDESLKRQFSILLDIGTAVLDQEDQDTLGDLQQEMYECVYDAEWQTCFDGEGDTCRYYWQVMATSTDYDELATVWKQWRDRTGRLMRQNYTDFVQLHNTAAQLNGHDDGGVYMRLPIDTPEFEEEVQALLDQIKPFYQELHGYTRHKLQERYPNNPFPESGHIPAHLLGNMWAQNWAGLQDILLPYPPQEPADITSKLLEMDLTVEGLARLAEDFFISIGFNELPPAFYELSLFERPDPMVVNVSCGFHAFPRPTPRIWLCGDVSEYYLGAMYSLLGFVEYMLAFQETQPYLFQEDANRAMSWAVTGAIGLSANAQSYLEEIGLQDEASDNQLEADINHLMRVALSDIAFLPFGLIVDRWRYDVFSGDITADHYNEGWWNLRCGFQGVSPPVQRSEEDFDPGAKAHISIHSPYMHFFLGEILKYQMHAELCESANSVEPLYLCSIAGSHEAGQQLIDMMKLGRSVPMEDAINPLVDDGNIDAQALLTYFEPLYDWLKQYNTDNNVRVGWDDTCPDSPTPAPPTSVAATVALHAASTTLLVVAIMQLLFVA